jgi:hypothetical protein
MRGLGLRGVSANGVRVPSYDSIPGLVRAYQSDQNTTGDPVSAWAVALGTGSDFVQATAGDRPDLGTIGSRAALVFPGSSENLDYDGAAGEWKKLHDGTGSTLVIAASLNLASSDVIFSTASGAVPTQVGVEIMGTAAGAVRVRVCNGTATLLVEDTSAAVVSDGVAFVLSLRMKTGATNEFDVRVNGTQVGNGTFVGTPSAADPTAAANLASRLGSGVYWDGKVGVVALYGYLTDATVAQAEAIVAARFAT